MDGQTSQGFHARLQNEKMVTKGYNNGIRTSNAIQLISLDDKFFLDNLHSVVLAEEVVFD